jgi:FlaA1/EpsC-like NDP-sugar epimerase
LSGSIGKELCKQIINLKPKKIVLYENNEFSLYNINLELKKLTQYVKVIPILSSTLDSLKFKESLINNQIHTVYHAAAYKHVPLVEVNPLDGIRNNIIGTYNCVKGAMDAAIDTFVLISTDKAVRPSNIMGTTKRFSELILQGAHKNSNGTCFSMVRFGNVLDSAGSVVPLFRKQINEGGPVTVTHPEVTRYFMSIPEAVESVIQAGAMAKGGDVFVLEMGSPIRIIDLAEKMIHLSGYVYKNSDNPDGDISIKITGLRPGEKLNEELIRIITIFICISTQVNHFFC